MNQSSFSSLNFSTSASAKTTKTLKKCNSEILPSIHPFGRDNALVFFIYFPSLIQIFQAADNARITLFPIANTSAMTHAKPKYARIPSLHPLPVARAPPPTTRCCFPAAPAPAAVPFVLSSSPDADALSVDRVLRFRRLGSSLPASPIPTDSPSSISRIRAMSRVRANASYDTLCRARFETCSNQPIDACVRVVDARGATMFGRCRARTDEA